MNQYLTSDFKIQLFAQEFLGDRDSQQDCHDYWDDEQGSLLLLADGAGGHQGGARASQIAGECARELWREQRARLRADASTLDALEDCLRLAHERILKETGDNDARRSGKAAVVLVYIDAAGILYCIHAGDCRLYINNYKKGWECLTRDDSMLQVGLEMGTIRPEEARHHPDQNILNQALGIDRMPRFHRLERTWTDGRALLLCCDGFWGQLPEDLWKDEAFLNKSDGTLLPRLVEAAYADAKGKSDNISVIHAQLPELVTPKQGNTLSTNRNQLLLAAGVCALALLTGGIVSYTLLYQNLKQESQQQLSELTAARDQQALQASQQQLKLLELSSELAETQGKLTKSTSAYSALKLSHEETQAALADSQSSLSQTLTNLERQLADNEVLRAEDQKQIQQLTQRLKEEERLEISFPAPFEPAANLTTEGWFNASPLYPSPLLKKPYDPQTRAEASRSTRLGMIPTETPRIVRMSSDGRFLLLIFETGALVLPHTEGSKLLIEELELPANAPTEP